MLPLRRGCGHVRHKADVFDGLRGFLHFLGAAPAVLSHAAEEIATLFFPVDRGKRLAQRVEQVFFDPVFA